MYRLASRVEDCAIARPGNVPMTVNGLLHTCCTETPVRCTVKKDQFGDIVYVWLKRPVEGILGGVEYPLLSPKCQTLLTEMSATGYELVEADVRLAFPHDIEQAKFKQLIVTGWGGIADPRSGIRPIAVEGKIHCYSFCKKPERILDTKQWDGSDFFRIWPTGQIWVSDRLAEAMKLELKLDNIYLMPVQYYRQEKAAGDRIGYDPSPLRLLYPDARAREIGEPLGIYWWGENR